MKRKWIICLVVVAVAVAASDFGGGWTWDEAVSDAAASVTKAV